MFLTRLTFETPHRKAAAYDVQDMATRYLAALAKNGQIYGDCPLSVVNGKLTAFVYIPRPDALSVQYQSEWVKEAFEQTVEFFGRSPTSQVLDDVVPKRFAPWQRSASFYLFTHFLSTESALCCGNTGLSLPLYLLPIAQQLREQIMFWASDYRSCDQLYMSSGQLEIPAYRQMADPDSELSNTGRSLCRQIEDATGKPTYYYLHRYWQQKTGEATRPCPSCGGSWHCSNRDALKNRGLRGFYFQCDRCRIVSDLATGDIHEKYARIGAYTS